MASIGVRRASFDDIDDLVALMREFYAESDYPLDVTWARQAFEQLLSDPSRGCVWLLTFENEIVGHVVLTVRFAMEFGGLSAYVDDLFVRASHRRRGVARAGLKELISEATRRGCRSLHVEVDPEDAAAMALYAEFGLAKRKDQRLELETLLRGHR
jgi:ribosomal protein S18 acetylase RimI-like enzyme